MASSLKNALLLGSLLVLVLACLAGPTAGASFGDRLLRTFFVFAELPLTAADAEAQGWTRMWGPCNPNIGYTYAQTASGATSWSPVLLYFTAAGQLSGFGVHATGWEPQYLVDRGFFTPTGLAQQYDIFIRTRDAKYMCSGEKSFDLLGDRLEINGFFPIPLNMSTAVKQGWAPGNCIGQMGIHYAYDLAAFGKNTWNASTLVPVMPMYDAERQTINAILFNLPHLEFGEPLGMFEGPLSTGLFCKNWCADSGCTFDIGGRSWSTMHFHFVDPSSISCSGAPCTLF